MLKRATKYGLIKAGLEAAALVAFTGLMKAARGRGAIFTLHHVGPPASLAFNPNGHLTVTPEFLDQAIVTLKREGYRFVHLTDIPALAAGKAGGPPLAAFTLDDGYRDNRDHALPVFERHGVPFTVFVCKGFSERSHTIWWETAERMINGAGPIEIETDLGRTRYGLDNRGDRIRTCDAICDPIVGPREAEAIQRLDRAALKMGIDPQALTADLVMARDELCALARHPLARLGAHTVSHRALRYLDGATLAQEIAESADYVEAITGSRPRVFAYPYGDRRSVGPEVEQALRAAGFEIAVTTTAGTLKPAQLSKMLALPRISLNGYYQKPRYARALASGIPFKLMGR